MIIIRPIAITDAILTSSNVPETDGTAGEWSVAVPYTKGDTVRVTTPEVHKVYEALEDVTGGDSPEDDVLNLVPKWLEIGATNRWAAFDDKVGSETKQAESITCELTPGVIVDSIAFLNLGAVTIRLVSTDPIEGVVYDKTVDLVSTVIAGYSGIYDWYSYFFSSDYLITDVVKLDLPPYLNAVLSITVSSVGDIASVGEVVIGVQANIGNTQYSPSIGIHDYSIKEQDQFGIWSIVERSFSKKMSCDLAINTASIANVQNLLASYRTTALVWVGSVDYPSLIVYGFYKDFSILISYPAYAIMNLEIEGLT